MQKSVERIKRRDVRVSVGTSASFGGGGGIQALTVRLQVFGAFWM